MKKYHGFHYNTLLNISAATLAARCVINATQFSTSMYKHHMIHITECIFISTGWFSHIWATKDAANEQMLAISSLRAAVSATGFHRVFRHSHCSCVMVSWCCTK